MEKAKKGVYGFHLIGWANRLSEFIQEFDKVKHFTCAQDHKNDPRPKISSESQLPKMKFIIKIFDGKLSQCSVASILNLNCRSIKKTFDKFINNLDGCDKSVEE